jgi:RNA recognition motif-containing protein
MKDRDNGKPRGFGFVTFETEEAVDKVLANLKEHKLMDKWVECKKATPKATPSKPPMSQMPPKRVSNL